MSKRTNNGQRGRQSGITCGRKLKFGTCTGRMVYTGSRYGHGSHLITDEIRCPLCGDRRDKISRRPGLSNLPEL